MNLGNPTCRREETYLYFRVDISLHLRNTAVNRQQGWSL